MFSLAIWGTGHKRQTCVNSSQPVSPRRLSTSSLTSSSSCPAGNVVVARTRTQRYLNTTSLAPQILNTGPSKQLSAVFTDTWHITWPVCKSHLDTVMLVTSLVRPWRLTVAHFGTCRQPSESPDFRARIQPWLPLFCGERDLQAHPLFRYGAHTMYVSLFEWVLSSLLVGPFEIGTWRDSDRGGRYDPDSTERPGSTLTYYMYQADTLTQ